MMNEELYEKVERFITVLQRGLDHYLNNWQQLQGKKTFPINSNEESYLAKNIIYNTRVMLKALHMTKTTEERELITESLQKFCDFCENHYSDFINNIEEEIKKNESKKWEIIASDLDNLFS